MLQVPPRPEIIRERYKAFFSRQSAFLETYKIRYLEAMNRRFAVPEKDAQIR